MYRVKQGTLHPLKRRIKFAWRGPLCPEAQLNLHVLNIALYGKIDAVVGERSADRVNRFNGPQVQQAVDQRGIHERGVAPRIVELLRQQLDALRLVCWMLSDYRHDTSAHA
ncbi:hypothetical protein AWB78_07928 [Caballeronia calidae]|uniref:Uncharacterized protein n=1 Tax=Caballeronia calidae TaxID=1777139 RepID=A0A158EH17_9BURK|nr:hypothetical protein AWB78_07928 [Caballeronia calidae]